jgi:hypothetical protein
MSISILNNTSPLYRFSFSGRKKRFRLYSNALLYAIAMPSPQPTTLKSAADTFPRKPPSNILKGYALKETSPFLSTIYDRHIVRDNFTISTWLLLGASLQCLLLVLPIRPSFAVFPTLLFLGYRLITSLLMSVGILSHSYGKDVVPSKTVAIYPESMNVNGEKVASDGGLCVIMLFARCNQSVLLSRSLPSPFLLLYCFPPPHVHAWMIVPPSL